MDADRDVVGDDRHVDRVLDVAEVVEDLVLVGDGVEGRGDDHRVDAGGLGGLGVADHPVGGGVDDAGDDRHAAVHLLDGVFEDLAAGGLADEDDLAGGAEHEEAVAAALDQVFEDPRVGRVVDAEVGVERA